MRSYSSYCCFFPVQKNLTGSPDLVPFLPRPATTSTRYFQKGYLERIYRAWPHVLILFMVAYLLVPIEYAASARALPNPFSSTLLCTTISVTARA